MRFDLSTVMRNVGCFLRAGEGDTGDVWRVVCNGDAWARDDSVSFKHVDTGAFLSVSGRTYGRPIQGQMEVVAVTRPDSASKQVHAYSEIPRMCSAAPRLKIQY